MRAPRTLRRPAAAALVVAVAVAGIAVACSSPPDAPPSVPQVFDLLHDATAAISPIDPARGEVTSADQLRLALEHHLAWHGVTLVEAMRAAERGVDAGPWIDALASNTDELVGLVGLVYGPVGADAFQQQWAQHTQFLIDYATADGRGDDDAATDARAALHDYTADSGSFFETATGGHLPADVATAALDEHVQHMLDMIDATAHDDATRSTRLAVDDHRGLYGIAGTLAGAISAQQPAAFPGRLDTPQAEYCSLANQTAGTALLRELGEHGEPVESEQAVSAARARLDLAANRAVATAPAP